MSNSNFGLKEMVEKALPDAASASTVASTELPAASSSVARRTFVQNTAISPLASRLLPGFMNILMAADGKEAMPVDLGEAAALPPAHPLLLIGKLAKAQSDTVNVFKEIFEAELRPYFAEVEDPVRRQKFAERMYDVLGARLAERTKVEKELFAHKDAVREFAEQHYD